MNDAVSSQSPISNNGEDAISLSHKAVDMVELWRGPFLESVHQGHAVICGADGTIIEAWGNRDLTILPRSSAKMIQALPLLESGACDAFGLKSHHLALACASHNGAKIHIDPVQSWLAHIGKSDNDLRCGTQSPDDRDEREKLIRAGEKPCQYHNNCSGKHAGFLTLNAHIGGSSEYIEPDHAVQSACLEAFERVTGERSAGFGIDGCSAPNFATTLHGLARAMAHFASAPQHSAEARLVRAMTAHPELVAGEGRACTRLMRAMGGRVAIKTGAEGVFVAIIPELKIGAALKIADGSMRACDTAIAQLLVRLGVLDANHPEALAYTQAPQPNRRGINAATLRACKLK